jgi:hypothetical protein
MDQETSTNEKSEIYNEGNIGKIQMYQIYLYQKLK